jgi:hypothetical protein
MIWGTEGMHHRNRNIFHVFGQKIMRNRLAMVACLSNMFSYPFPPPSNLWYKNWTLLPGNDLYMVFSNGYSMYIYILFMYPLLCSIWHVYVIYVYIYNKYIICILYPYYYVYILPRLEVHQEAEVKVAEVVCWCFFLLLPQGKHTKDVEPPQFP